MNTQGECAKCHVPMEVGYAFYFPRWRWLCAAKLVPGKAEIELLDGSRGEERSKRPHHNASLPKLWVFGVVRNQNKVQLANNPVHFFSWADRQPTSAVFLAYSGQDRSRPRK
jgi:hypothetical protein